MDLHLVDKVARVSDPDSLPFVIRPQIKQSWIRSAQAGLAPDRVEVPYDPDVDRDGRLRAAAAPVMEAVAQDLSDLMAAMLLTDARGHVIERWTHNRYAGNVMDAFGAAPGFHCGESAVGTNAIGSAILDHGTAIVLGDEHFAHGLSAIGCVARGVRDPVTGRLLGTIDITCQGAAYSPVMAALIGRVAHETEARLLEDSESRSQPLYGAFLQARRTAKGPLVAVDSRTTFSNAAAGGMLTSADREVIWTWAQDRLARRVGEQTTRLTLATGDYPARCRAVRDGDTLIGAVAWLYEKTPRRNEPVALPGSRARDALTPSEMSVAEQVARGLTNREAASRLLISPHTVDYHLRHIFQKFGISSRVELVRIVASWNIGE